MAEGEGEAEWENDVSTILFFSAYSLLDWFSQLFSIVYSDTYAVTYVVAYAVAYAIAHAAAYNVECCTV